MLKALICHEHLFERSLGSGAIQFCLAYVLPLEVMHCLRGFDFLSLSVSVSIGKRI